VEEDPTTQEMRIKQRQREGAERESADESPLEDDTAQHKRRADKASYLAEKLEERAKAERKAAAEEDHRGREMQRDHEERTDELMEDADRIEEASKDLEGDIRETKTDWETKKGDSQVPGALEEGDAGDAESDSPGD